MQIILCIWLLIKQLKCWCEMHMFIGKIFAFVYIKNVFISVVYHGTN